MISLPLREPRKAYTERLIFMAALLIPAVFMMGVRTLFVSALSVGACMLTDRIACAVRKIRYDVKDAAVPFWGLCAAMLMPSSIPYGLVVFSAIVIAVLGKHVFGASDNIVFSPPAISAALLIICYPQEMLSFPKYDESAPIFGEYAGAAARSVEYSLRLGNVPSASWLDILLGTVPGAIGAVSILIILVCGVCLLVRGSSSPAAALPCLGVCALLAFLYPRAEYSGLMSVFYELSSGYLLFGVFFMAAEPYLLPKRFAARIMYGVALGYTTMMFRNLGQTEGSFIFALLIVSALSCSFDTIVENVSYWSKSYLNSYEKSVAQVQRGKVKLTDTQEIILPKKYRFNTPPIDGEIKKHRRRERKEGDDDGE